MKKSWQSLLLGAAIGIAGVSTAQVATRQNDWSAHPFSLSSGGFIRLKLESAIAGMHGEGFAKKVSFYPSGRKETSIAVVDLDYVKRPSEEQLVDAVILAKLLARSPAMDADFQRASGWSMISTETDRHIIVRAVLWDRQLEGKETIAVIVDGELGTDEADFKKAEEKVKLAGGHWR